MGIGSFAHLKYVKCLAEPRELFDIAIIGVPFDTAVSYRPGTWRVTVGGVICIYLSPLS
jgi:arginase family enzyme